MKNRKTWISIMAGVLAAVMVLSIFGTMLITIANAEESSSEIKEQINDLKDQKAEIDAQIKDLENQISDNMGEMEKMVAEKGVIDQEVFLLNEQMININAQITAYGQLVADKQDELEEAQARKNALMEKSRDRIVAMEKNGFATYWSVLFQATSFVDFLDRARMVKSIEAADKACLKELSEAADQVAAAKAELEAEVKGLEAAKAELEATEAELAEKRAQVDQLLQELVKRGDEYAALVQEAEDEIGKLMQEIAQKQEEYDEAKYREYLEWLAQQPPPPPPPSTTKPPSSGNTGNVGGSGTALTPRTVNGITWLVPVTYTHFTSPYGYRIHPIYGDWRKHHGVDLSAPSGTPIYASRAGVVSIATYGSSGGYYVAINHQDGFSTQYLHMTHYIVSPGQKVAAGQVIGYVGSTGAATGPHLHFGVFFNGESVNPADYIAI